MDKFTGRSIKMVYFPRKFNINYSTKNIPTVSKYKYQYLLTNRIENLVGRMRWKVYWDKNKDKRIDRECYGFPSLSKPPPCEELKEFEEDLYKLISMVETKQFRNPLQETMKNDLKLLKDNPNQVVVASDKTSNFFLMDDVSMGSRDSETFERES